MEPCNLDSTEFRLTLSRVKLIQHRWATLIFYSDLVPLTISTRPLTHSRGKVSPMGLDSRLRGEMVFDGTGSLGFHISVHLFVVQSKVNKVGRCIARTVQGSVVVSI